MIQLNNDYKELELIPSHHYWEQSTENQLKFKSNLDEFSQRFWILFS